MHDLTETQNFDANVTVPDDGVDYRTAVSLSLKSLQQLTNRTRYLKDLLSGVLTGIDVSLRRNVFVGAVLQVTGLTQLLANLTVAGTSALHSTSVSGTLNVSSDVTHNGLTHLQGATDATDFGCTNLAATGATQLGTSITDTCEVNASINMRAPARCYDALYCQNNLIIGSVGAALQGAMQCTGAGRVVRPAVVGSQTGSSTVITPASATTYYFPTVTADQNFNLPALATNGDEIEISTGSSAFYVNVRTPAGVTIQSLKYGSGFTRYLKVKYIAGVWTELLTQSFP